MKLRNLFYALLALPLVFAACEEIAPEPEPEVKGPVLTLTSEATLNFEAAGGEGVIIYTLENAVEGTNIVPTCSAAWITDLTVAENITFNVAANDGEARNTKIKVEYGSKNFEVAVNQAAAEQPGPGPDPDDAVRFEATMIEGEYYGDEYSPGVGNYYIILTDNGMASDGNLKPNSTYYIIDVYGALVTSEDNYVAIPVGEYTFDATDSMAEGTFSSYYSQYAKTSETEVIANDIFSSGKLVVTETGMTFEATLSDGEKHIVTYNGECKIVNTTKSATDVEVTLDHCYAVYYGDMYTPGTADNFYFFISDIGLDAEGYEQGNGTYYRFDIYTDIVDRTNGVAMPYGTYTWDSASEGTAGTIAEYYSLHYIYNADVTDYEFVDYPVGGSVTVDANGVTATMVFRNGATHTIHYSGEVLIYDDSDGGDDGGDDSGDDGNDDGGSSEGLSTLTENLEFNINNAIYMLEYYGDYYENGTDNWVLYIYEDAVDFNGAYIMIDFLNDPYASNIAGTYTASTDQSMNTFFNGYADDDGLYGSWYADMIEGNPSGILAPLADGSITIEQDSNEVCTLTFDCTDGAGHTITGTIVAAPYGYAYAAAPASRTIKSTRVANVTKSRVEATTSMIKGNISMR